MKPDPFGYKEILPVEVHPEWNIKHKCYQSLFCYLAVHK